MTAVLEPLTPGPARPWPVRRALVAALVAGAALGFVFALRAGAVLAPLTFVVLRRGVTARTLALAAGAVLLVAVPVAHLAAGLPDEGYDTGYAVARIAEHWLAVGAVVRARRRAGCERSRRGHGGGGGAMAVAMADSTLQRSLWRALERVGAVAARVWRGAFAARAMRLAARTDRGYAKGLYRVASRRPVPMPDLWTVPEAWWSTAPARQPAAARPAPAPRPARQPPAHAVLHRHVRARPAAAARGTSCAPATRCSTSARTSASTR